MKYALRNLADVLDGVAMLGAVLAAYIFVTSFGTIETGPGMMQVGLFALVVAIVPYCIAGALHRIVTRLD